MLFNHHRCAVALMAAAALPLAASAQSTPWSVRLGITDVQMANKSDPIPALSVPTDAIHVGNKTIPEVDIYYGVTPNWVAELVLTYPQTANVTLEGGSIGSFKFLPPSLLAQYHFLPSDALDPYVGLGLNFTWITSVNLNVAGVGPLDLKKSSFGAIAELGANYNVDKQWYVNANVKYINPLQSDVSAGGSKVSTAKLDPYLYSLGVGYRF
jgi:outer membrane protein